MKHQESSGKCYLSDFFSVFLPWCRVCVQQCTGLPGHARGPDFQVPISEPLVFQRNR